MNLINNLGKNEEKYLVLLYSGNYNYENEGNCDFVVNPNFFYLTKCCIPNCIFIFENNNLNIFLGEEYFKRDIKKIKYIKNLKKYTKKYDILGNINDFIKNNYKNKINKIYLLNEIKKNIVNLGDFELDFSTLNSICNEKRQIKNKEELKNISIACQETHKLFKMVIEQNMKLKFKNCQEIVNFLNKNIENKFPYSFRAICSTGENSNILHYNFYDSKISKKNNLILLDIGLKINGYCSDITRTFPGNNVFSSKELVIYNIVLETQKYAISLLKPKAILINIVDKTLLFLFKKLLDINLIINPPLKDEKKIEIVKKFMYHSLGHFIGIEVHDIGKIQVLEENMVLTIEPGIYFSDRIFKKNKYLNIKEITKYKDIGGIRIEDTIQITNRGNKIL